MLSHPGLTAPLRGRLAKARLLATLKGRAYPDPMSDSPQPGEEGGSGSTGSAAEGHGVQSADRRPIRSARSRGTRATRLAWRRTFSSLSYKNYLYLWMGIVFWAGGMQIQMLARAYLVYDLTDSAGLLGMVNAAAALPMLALPLLGGVIADRFERKRIIQLGQLASMLLAVVVGIAITTDVIAWYHLLIAAMAQGVFFSFSMPARQAFIAQLVPRHEFTNALALNAGAMSAMTLIAPAVGGVLYALTGPDVVYYLIGGLSAVAVVLTGFVSGTTEGVAPARRGMARVTMFSDISAGVGYAFGHSLIRVLLIVTLCTTLLTMPFQFLMPVFVVDVYHLGPDAMGLLIAITGGASLVGSLAIAALGSWKRGLLLLGGSALSGVALMLVAVVPIYYAAAGFMLLLGLGNAGRRTLVQTLVMEASDESYRGRVISLYMMNFGLIQLGVLPIGMLMDVLGGQLTLGGMAVLLLVVTAVAMVTQRELREAN